MPATWDTREWAFCIARGNPSLSSRNIRVRKHTPEAGRLDLMEAAIFGVVCSQVCRLVLDSMFFIHYRTDLPQLLVKDACTGICEGEGTSGMEKTLGEGLKPGDGGGRWGSGSSYAVVKRLAVCSSPLLTRPGETGPRTNRAGL